MKIKLLYVTFIMLIFQACLPEQQVRTLEDTTVESSNNNNDSDISNQNEINFVKTGIGSPNFFQQGSTQTSTTLSLFSDFKDSFIMRGNNLASYLVDTITYTYEEDGETLTGIGQTPTLCMIFEFNQTTTNGKRLLGLAARVRFFENQALQGREYFVQMDVNNQSINSSDCLNINLSNAIFQKYGTNDVVYTIAEVCPDCQLNKNSIGLTLFNSNGLVIEDVNLGNLTLGIIPQLGSGSGNVSGNSCNTDGACQQQGFNCCLNGQCVNHGEVKEGVNTSSSEYLSALQQILTRPERIKDYQDFFYVCNELIPTDPDNSGDDPDLDPIQQANDLFDELQDLYNCLNPVIDEFSICTYEKQIDIDNIGNGGTSFVMPADDITFKKTNGNLNFFNIVNINYAGERIYQDKLYSTDTLIPADPSIQFVGSANDELFVGQSIIIDRPLAIDAPRETAKIRYRIDGTCERLGSNLAKCTKSYVQGQNSSPPRSSDHAGGNQIFKLPTYANLGFNVIVEVGGLRVAPGTDTWQTETLSGVNTAISTDKQVRFTGMTIANGQTVDITYYVSQFVDQLMLSKDTAQAQVNSHCHCDEEIGCNLQPVTSTVNGVEQITSYECLYPQPDVPPMPLQETFYVSAKSVAHRYFDVNGVSWDFNDIGSGDVQEGTKFEYASGNVLKPNNTAQTIGFNEIYGSFSRETDSAMPAYMLEVEKGKNYDIFVDGGAFSSCLNCGVDPYGGVQKLFPNSFLHAGGGYLPDVVESRRRDNQGKFSSDEMKFGRACFVPATMIPWTHAPGSTVQEQRQARLSAQHFLFANGYNRDWYGFDYGSLIASYDGVKWFSVGNQRRIQAKANKIYFAINAYFGDLTVNNTFKVTVNETSAILNSGSAITHDTDSDGAQCQRSHYCSTDNDCITQLGYEYTCQNVSSLKTPWPLFDANANEIVGSTELFLSSIVGGVNGQVKRCVYRGKGSICQENLASIDSNNSYSKSSNIAFHACSPNTYCESLSESKFNTKIARYADTPVSQNNKTYITTDANQGSTDTYGLAARFIGRPFNYYGDEEVPNNALLNLNNNDVQAICIPGKEPSLAATFNELNSSVNTPLADKVFGIGRTQSTSTLQDEAYYAACPATDEDGNYMYFDQARLNESTVDISDDSINSYAISQNLSTNLMDLDIFDELQLFNDDSANITRLGYQKNACLRSAGSKCYTDLDCAPNRFITTKVKTLTDFGALNVAEQAFWQEELTCGYAAKRYPDNGLYPDPFYDITEHKCCMEQEKNFTYKTQPHEGSTFDVVLSDADRTPAIAGVNIDYNSERRYSKNNNVYDKLVNDPDRYAPLYHAAKQPAAPFEINKRSEMAQYTTLHLNNSRMCCTGHWVREFADGANGNGGGHIFTPNRLQNLPPITFRPLSWFDNNIPSVGEEEGDKLPYTCDLDNYTTVNCEVKNIVEDSAEEKKYLNFFGKLELLGIPQVLVETVEDVRRPLGDDYIVYNNAAFNIDDQEEVPATMNLPLHNTIKSHLNDLDSDGSIDAVVDVIDNTNGGKKYFSAASYDNFQMEVNQLKKVFSEDEFACCLPTGLAITDLSIPESACCTGRMNALDANSNVCCLEDFTDLSVYTNRYVSSEGASFNGQDIEDSDIDPESGYIKPEKVLEMGPTMCCSGQATTGVALGLYYIPIEYTSISQDQAKTRRWLYDSTLDNADEVGGGITKYNAGMKFNNHIYCVPPGFADSSGNSGGGSGGSGGGGAISN